MPEEKKVILIDVEVNEGEAQKQVDALSKSITVLKAETKDLQNVNKTLAEDGKVLSAQYVNNTKEILANQEQIKQNTTERRLLVQSLGAENNSLEAVKVSSAQLRAERMQLDLSTKEGITRLGEINDKLKENKETQDEANSVTAKGTTGWANYKEGLDKVVPGLGGVISGIEGTIKAGLAFIATPIGAVIAAIGLALGALIAYFKSSEEGQNNLNKILLVASSIWEQLKNFVENAGEAIFKAISDPKQAIQDFGNFIIQNITNRFIGMLELIPKLGEAIGLAFKGEFAEAGKVAFDAVTKVALGVENASQKIAEFAEEVVKAVDIGIAAGKKLAQLQADIDKNERELIVEREAIRIEVAKKREEALTQEHDTRKKTIGEAIELIQKLSDAELAQAQRKLAQAKLELQTNGDDKEAKLKVAEATAAVIRAEALRYEEAFKLRKQFEALDAQELADKKKLLDEKAKADKAAFDKEWAEEVKRRQALNAATEKDAEEDLKKREKEAAAIEKIEQGTSKAAIDLAGQVFGKKQEARVAYNLLFKQDAVKEIAVNTYKAAIAAYNALAGIPYVGPVLGAIAAAAVGAFGLAQEAAVLGITFKEGGQVGKKGSGWFSTIGGKRHSEGGTKFYGEDGTRFEAEADEGIFILKREAHRNLISELSNMNTKEGGRPWISNPVSNRFAQGGEVLSAQADRTISNDRQLRQIADAILNQPRKVVVIEDVESLTAQRTEIRENASF